MDAPIRGVGDIGRYQAHRRVKKLWGSASNYPCVNCGQKSCDWAYDGTDPTQRLGKGSNNDRKSEGGRRVGWFSVWPEFYKPMCRSCHIGHDRRSSAEELQEYRRWRMRIGMTLSEVEEKLCRIG